MNTLEKSLARLGNPEFPPFILEVLKEACEQADNSDLTEDRDSLVIISFQMTLSALKGIIEGLSIEQDLASFNYRGQVFDLSPGTPDYQYLIAIV